MRIKNWMTLLFFSLFALAFSACQEKGAKLKAAAEKANEDCPVSIGEAGEMTSVTSDGKTLTLTFRMNEDLLNIKQIREVPEVLRASALALVKNATGDTKEMIDLLKEERAGLNIVYTGDKSGQKVSVELSYGDLAGASKAGEEQGQSPLEMLEAQIRLAKHQMPMKIEKGMSITDVNLKGIYVVYDVEVDESMYSVDALKENADAIKTEVTKNLSGNDVSMKEFVQTCKKAGKGIAYCYVGNRSGDKCVVKVRAEELQ